MEYLLRNACFDEHEYMSMNAFPAIRAPKGQKANEWKIIRKYWKPLGQGRLGPFPSQVGPCAHTKPLLSRSTTGEFHQISPQTLADTEEGVRVASWHEEVFLSPLVGARL